MEDQPTRVLDRTAPQASSGQGGRPPRGSGRPPGREPEAVYRRRRLIAAGAGGLVFLLLIVLIASAGGDDPEPKSTPSDLGVDSSPTLTTPDTTRDRKTRTETDSADTGGSTATPVAPTTPPATGGTGGGTTATPVAPAQPEGTGGGAGQPVEPAPAPPTGEGGGAAAPPGD